MGRYRDNEELVKKWIPRIFAILSSCTIWMISVIFSSDGFGFDVANDKKWMGTAIAVFGVTSLELLFNNGHHEDNPTLTMLCVSAYAYGIVSNIMGLWILTGSPAFGLTQEFAISMAKSIPLGILLEVMPEPMMLVGLGIKSGGEDAISQISNLFSSFSRGDDRPRGNDRDRNRDNRGGNGHGYGRPDEEMRQAISGEREITRCPRCKSKKIQLDKTQGVFHCHECSLHMRQKSREDGAAVDWNH